MHRVLRSAEEIGREPLHLERADADRDGLALDLGLDRHGVGPKPGEDGLHVGEERRRLRVLDPVAAVDLDQQGLLVGRQLERVIGPLDACEHGPRDGLGVASDRREREVRAVADRPERDLVRAQRLSQRVQVVGVLLRVVAAQVHTEAAPVGQARPGRVCIGGGDGLPRGRIERQRDLVRALGGAF